MTPATNDLKHAFDRSLNRSVQERALGVVIFWAVVLGAVTDSYLDQSGLEPPDWVLIFWAVVLAAVTDYYLDHSGLEPPDCMGPKIRGWVYLQSQ